MKEKYFSNKSYCEFAIISQDIYPEEITNSLGIQPGRSFKKGDIVVSKHSKNVGKKPHNLWAVSSPEIVTNIEDLNSHFAYLSKIFQSKMDILERYKKDSRFELSLWIWVETKNAGIGFDLKEDQLTFINKICNRCSFSLLATESVS